MSGEGRLGSNVGLGEATKRSRINHDALRATYKHNVARSKTHEVKWEMLFSRRNIGGI